MGVIGKLLGRFNAFDPKRDSFAGAVTDASEQTKFGAFLSVVVLPACVAAYSALYFIQFYYGFGESAPPLYMVTTSETLQYGNQVKELAIECTNPYGCYFRLPQGGATMCQSGKNDQETPTNDFCDAQPASGRRLLADDEHPWRESTRHLLTSHNPPQNNNNQQQNNNAPSPGPAAPAASEEGPDAPKCADKVECGVVMDGDDGVCAYVAPGSDPTDALTIAWKDDGMTSNDPNAKCTGHCNFGVSLVTDYLDEPSKKIKQKKIRAHRGIVLLSLVERHDPRMEWDSSHPDFATKSGRSVVYEWGITPVDIVGTIQSSNLCLSDLKAEYGQTGDDVNAKGIKFNPFPLYTKVTTTYPSPVMAYLAAVGGIAATLGGMFGIVHTVHIEMLKRKDAVESGLRQTGMFNKPPAENAA